MAEAEYSIVPITFSDLSHDQLSFYKGMLEKEYWHYFKNTRSEALIAKAIFYHKEPVGIALAEAVQQPGFIKSIFAGVIYQFSLQSTHNSEKLFDQTLALIEEDLKKKHCVVISFSTLSIGPLEIVLKRRGWKGPKAALCQYEIDSDTFAPPWFNKIVKTPLPQQFSIFKWKNIKQSEWNDLKNRESNYEIPDYVSPFNKYDGTPEPLNSLGLKHNDSVIGWILTHKIKEKLRYTNFYINRNYEFSGLGLKLLSEAISLQKGHVKWALFEFNGQQVPPYWKSFVVKHLAPWAVRKEQWHEWWLDIKG